MDKSKIIIESALNGYILTNHYLDEVNEEGKEIYKDDVEIFEDNLEPQTSGVTHLLYRVAELLGFSYDKWDSENIKITFDNKGSKVE